MKHKRWKFVFVVAMVFSGLILAATAIFGTRILLLPLAILPGARDELAKNAPIEFYGEILDQDGKGIPEVQIEAEAHAASLLPNPHGYGGSQTVTKLSATTDAQGRFAFRGVSGMSVVLKSVQKDGFIAHPDTITGASYGPTRNPEEPIVNAANPRVMHMWRKTGAAANLLVIRSTNLYFDEASGTQTINLTQFIPDRERGKPWRICITASRGKSVDPAAIRGSGTHYDWAFEIEMEDAGGLIATDDAFLFRAPENGYTSRYSFKRLAGDADWSSSKWFKFYLRGPENNYGALLLEVTTHWRKGPGVYFAGCVNPTGSPNLEH